MSEPPMHDTLETYVHSPEFDKHCVMYSKGIDGGSPSDNSNSDYSFSSVKSSPYDVSKLKAHLYYFGIRGPGCWGPKLIFRTSKDIFTVPLGPEWDPRLMQLWPVYGHNKLGKDSDNLWTSIHTEVVRRLDQRNIQFSSVDLVHFSWEDVKENKDMVEDRDAAVWSRSGFGPKLHQTTPEVWFRFRSGSLLQPHFYDPRGGLVVSTTTTLSQSDKRMELCRAEEREGGNSLDSTGKQQD
ncbi:hypothetical protein EDB85DRAFT_1885168 [Lactarius pseudohatsudake]|nr:hypothetical protein EDB85DRAFT_1885168 [Lactarius pseudohatsudake]